MAGKILVASQSFVLWDAGRMLRFRRNRTTIREGHRLLEGNEERFKPLSVDFDIESRPTVQAVSPTPSSTVSDLVCPTCGFEAGSAIGLRSHIRAKHA